MERFLPSCSGWGNVPKILYKKNDMIRAAAKLIILLALVGCDTTQSLQTLRTAPLSGSPFEMALAKHYLAFSELELKRYNWWNSKYFADKGLQAAYGKAAGPEAPSAWGLPAATRDEILNAYQTLTKKLTADFKKHNPDSAASAQFNFDCWVAEQEKNTDSKAIATCRDGFLDQLDETDPPIAQGGPLATSFMLNFGWDSTEAQGLALQELDDLARTIKRHRNYRIIINGHADRSGSDDYNMQLSQQRADFIRQMLIGRGVLAERVEYYAFGESDPKIETADGVRNNENRRVEIFIE